jgi:hypothetical protein
MHWVDNTCRHSKLQAVYSYILASCCFNAIRALADVFVLLGLFVLADRLNGSLGERVVWAGWVVIGAILSFLAIYHVCLLFSLSFAWLAFADLYVINSIAKARNAFEIVFTVIYFYPCSIFAIFGGMDAPRDYAEVRSLEKTSTVFQI